MLLMMRLIVGITDERELKIQMNRAPFRTLLVLGRVSNLPTVWSNCLASWMLTAGLRSDATGWPLLLLLIVGTTFLYLGGMYLNDAFDVAFDTTHRPERPIPSRRISRRAVAVLGCVWMISGFVLLVPVSGGWAIALAGLIVLYDAAHKKTALGLLMMAGCRALIYPMAGVAAWSGAAHSGSAVHSLPPMLWIASGGMALWVLILSILARRESRLTVAVPNLLAAIPLLDLLFVSPQSILHSLPFLCFTALALLLRRRIPPT